jgi:hypothetical protein
MRMAIGGNFSDLEIGDSTYSATEDSAERGFTGLNRKKPDPDTYETLGRAAELGHDETGDIADEGRGHRG